MGFDNPGQISSAKLGSPIRRFAVRLDELKIYESGKNPKNLLHETAEILFPVDVSDEARSSLTVGRSGDNWAPTSFGGTNYIRLLSNTREKLAKEEDQPIEAYIEVRIPALNLTFLGRDSEDKLLLTPIVAEPRFGFVAGKPLVANQVFTSLVPFV